MQLARQQWRQQRRRPWGTHQEETTERAVRSSSRRKSSGLMVLCSTRQHSASSLAWAGCACRRARERSRARARASACQAGGRHAPGNPTILEPAPPGHPMVLHGAARAAAHLGDGVHERVLSIGVISEEVGRAVFASADGEEAGPSCRVDTADVTFDAALHVGSVWAGVKVGAIRVAHTTAKHCDSPRHHQACPTHDHASRWFQLCFETPHTAQVTQLGRIIRFTFGGQTRVSCCQRTLTNTRPGWKSRSDTGRR